MGLLKVVGIAGIAVAALLIWKWLDNGSKAEPPKDLSDVANKVHTKLLERLQTKDMIDELNDQAQRRYDKKVIHNTAVALGDNELIEASYLDDLIGREAAGWVWGFGKLVSPSIAQASLVRAAELEAQAWREVTEVS